ncbi:MAG: ComF family protein [Candidatus Helarchaeota archaeon]
MGDEWIREDIIGDHHILNYFFEDFGMNEPKKLRLYDLKGCPICLDSKTNGKTCPKCKNGRAFHHVESLSIYLPGKDAQYSEMSKIILQMKPKKPDKPWQKPWSREEKSNQGKILARLLEWYIKNKSTTIDLNSITCMTSVPSKYPDNQVEYFGYPLKDRLNIEYPNYLGRTPNDQYELAYRDLISERPLENKDVLLLDDTYTDGKTKETCCRFLKQIGARKIVILVLGRTIPPQNWNARYVG